MHALRRCCPLLFFTVLVLGFAGCGGGGNSQSAAPTPVFTSTPVQAAVEGSPYSYQLAASDSAGSPISYALTNAPEGATLNGNTITWTPTAAQSRVANSFTVTARSSTGGSATQSWSVTPNGTVRVSWAYTYWAPSGPITVPHDWRLGAQYAAVLAPQADGSFQTLQGTVDANGVFTIPNVPAGYYWLRLAPRATYWTSSSVFDAGTDILGSPMQSTGTIASSTTRTIQISLQGLDPVSGNGVVQLFVPREGFISAGFTFPTVPGSDTLATSVRSSGNVDFSQLGPAFLLQYKPASLGTRNALVLGPALSLSDVRLSNTGVSTINETLSPSPQSSLNLVVKGTAWKTLFDNAAPTPVTSLESSFRVSLAPFSSRYAINGNSIDLLRTISSEHSVLIDFLNTPGPCTGMFSMISGSGFISPLPSPSTTAFTDQDYGTVQYGDPFPSSWLRSYQICQRATVQVPLPSSTFSETFVLSNGAATALPNATAEPLISPVQNPTINGTSLLSATTINSSDITLSWSAPALGSPVGYGVHVFIASPLPVSPGFPVPAGPSTAYGEMNVLSTAKTSLRIPPGVIAPGNTYVFLITALADAGANMESSPNRSALPVANADLISAPITIGSAEQ